MYVLRTEKDVSEMCRGHCDGSVEQRLVEHVVERQHELEATTRTATQPNTDPRLRDPLCSQQCAILRRALSRRLGLLSRDRRRRLKFRSLPGNRCDPLGLAHLVKDRLLFGASSQLGNLRRSVVEQSFDLLDVKR